MQVHKEEWLGLVCAWLVGAMTPGHGCHCQRGSAHTTRRADALTPPFVSKTLYQPCGVGAGPLTGFANDLFPARSVTHVHCGQCGKQKNSNGKEPHALCSGSALVPGALSCPLALPHQPTSRVLHSHQMWPDVKLPCLLVCLICLRSDLTPSTLTH